MKKKITLPVFLLIILLLFTTCSGEGIFYQIQNEVKIEDRGLPNVKFSDVHNTNPAASTGFYIARGVKLWYRSKSLASGWTKIDLPAGADAIQSSAMYTPATPANIAFYYTVKSGDNTVLYRVDGVNTATPSPGSKAFTLSPATSGNYMVLQLYSNEDSGQNRLFMNAVEYNKDGNPVSSVLYFYGTDGRIFLLADMTLCTTTLNNKPIRTKGMAFGSGGNTWLIYNDDSSVSSGGNLYFSSNNFTGVNTKDTAISNGWYEAIYGRTIGTDLVIVSAQTGASTYNLFSNEDTDGAGTWKTSYDGDALISCFAWAGYATALPNYIVAGTRRVTTGTNTSYAKGVYLINTSTTSSLSVSEDSGTLGDSSNYNSSDLKTSSINSIIVDDYIGGSIDFTALSASSKDSTNGGVWFLNGSTRIWNHE